MTHPVAAPQQLARVVFWMTGTLLSFSVMAVSIRALAGALNIVEILSLRAAVGLAIVGAMLALRPRLRGNISRRRLPLHTCATPSTSARNTCGR